MTPSQKTVIAAVLAVATGIGIYEARQASQLREANETLRQQQAALAQQIQPLRRELEALTNRLAALADEAGKGKKDNAELLKLRGQASHLRTEKQEASGSEARSWLDRANRLKQRLEESPNASIPELRLLKQQDWLDVVKRFDLKDEKEFPEAFSQARLLAEMKVGAQLQAAMRKYAEANPGAYASDLSLLKPYLDPAIDDSMLRRYVISPSDAVQSMKLGGEWVITLKAPVDAELDAQVAVGQDGFGSTSFGRSEILQALSPALKAYQAANNGKLPESTAQLAPYISTPEQQAAFQKAVEQEKAK